MACSHRETIQTICIVDYTSDKTQRSLSTELTNIISHSKEQTK